MSKTAKETDWRHCRQCKAQTDHDCPECPFDPMCKDCCDELNWMIEDMIDDDDE